MPKSDNLPATRKKRERKNKWGEEGARYTHKNSFRV